MKVILRSDRMKWDVICKDPAEWKRLREECELEVYTNNAFSVAWFFFKMGVKEWWGAKCI